MGNCCNQTPIVICCGGGGGGNPTPSPEPTPTPDPGVSPGNNVIYIVDKSLSMQFKERIPRTQDGIEASVNDVMNKGPHGFRVLLCSMSPTTSFNGKDEWMDGAAVMSAINSIEVWGGFDPLNAMNATMGVFTVGQNANFVPGAKTSIIFITNGGIQEFDDEEIAPFMEWMEANNVVSNLVLLKSSMDGEWDKVITGKIVTPNKDPIIDSILTLV